MSAPVLDPAALDGLARLGGEQLVGQMIALFLEHGPERIAALLESAQTGSADGVERAAHTLKSSAGNLGAVRLQQSAEAVEADAGGAEPGEGTFDPVLVERVRTDYEETMVALRKALQARQL